MARRRLPRREFLRSTAAGVSVLATGCGKVDDPDGAGTEGTGDGSAGSTGTGGSAGTADGSSDDADSTGGDPLGFDPAEVPESVELFPRAVFAGAMTPDSVIISGHSSTPGPLRLIVWQLGDDGSLSVAFDEASDTDDDGFIKVTVGGLAAGQWYSYALFVAGDEEPPPARGVLGEVRTALAPDAVEPVTIAMAACVGHGTLIPDFVNPDDLSPKFFDAFTQMEEHDYDVLVHLGDQGYFDLVFNGGGGYAEYLAAWGAYHEGSYRSLTALSGMIHTWDDHEVSDNTTFIPWTDDADARARIDDAVRAYFTIMPIDAATSADALWTSYQWGLTVEFIVLDCRHERTPPPDGQYVSADQMAFLLDRLANSPCYFKAIVNSVPFATTPAMLDADDRWEGYPDQREEVRAFIEDQGIQGVLWLTGDSHLCSVGRTEEGGGGNWEVGVTSGNTSPFADTLPPDQFDWVAGEPHVPILTFDAEAGTVVVTFYRIDGTVGHEQTLTFGV